MGVFDFVKEAGAKVGIGESKAEAAAREAAEAAAEAKAQKDASDKRAQSAAKWAADRKAKGDAADKKERDARAKEMKEKYAESQKATGLENYVEKLGLNVKNLDIRFDDGVATISGEAPDQDTRERVILAVGNTDGVETVSETITVASGGAESALHVVVKGDTLWAIAKARLGDGNRYPEIFEANRPMLSDPNKIFVGQVLRIPGGN